MILAISIAIVGNVNADFDAGGAAYKRGDFETAAQEFIPLVNRGDHRAMYALGSLYASGLGVEKNLTRAFELFYQAAKYGRVDAMYKLGVMYEEGLGTGQDYRKALRQYQKSAKAGYPLSQYRFGRMYAAGKGVKSNPVTAYAWLIIAAHYFVYESGQPLEELSGNDFENQIQMAYQQDLNRITEDIIEQLQVLRRELTKENVEQIRQKVVELSQYKKHYHHESVRNVYANGSIEKLFLPDTLY